MLSTISNYFCVVQTPSVVADFLFCSRYTACKKLGKLHAYYEDFLFCSRYTACSKLGKLHAYYVVDSLMTLNETVTAFSLPTDGILLEKLLLESPTLSWRCHMLLQVASSPMAKTHLLKCPCLSEHTGKLISTNCSRNRRKFIVKMSMLVSNSDKSYPREPNPILQALQEKKQNFKRMASEVGSMASEIRDVRSRLATQEASLSRETACRQVAEANASSMETELRKLEKNLEERDSQLQTSASVAEQVKMPDGRRRTR